MPAKIISWNCRGACERRVFAEILRRAKALGADAICLQEHKWRSNTNLEMARACARVAGFALWVRPGSVEINICSASCTLIKAGKKWGAKKEIGVLLKTHSPKKKKGEEKMRAQRAKKKSGSAVNILEP